jgi:hypothetical protein
LVELLSLLADAHKVGASFQGFFFNLFAYGLCTADSRGPKRRKLFAHHSDIDVEPGL